MPDLDQIKQGEQGARDGRGRFATGRSSNPAGRPRGCRDHVNRAARLLLAGKGEALARKAVEQPCGSRIYPTAMPTILVGINLVDRGASTASYRRCGISEGGPMSEA